MKTGNRTHLLAIVAFTLVAIALVASEGVAAQGRTEQGPAGQASRNGSRGSLRSHPPASVITGTWANLYPLLGAMSASPGAQDDAWAAGDYGHLLHFTGGGWVAVDPPNLRGYALSKIQMLSANDGWIAAGPLAFQYNGSTWQARSQGIGPDVTLTSISALSDTDVWAVGYLDTHSLYFPLEPAILHWNGAQWSNVPTGLPNPIGYYYLLDIAMISPTDGWAAGWFDFAGAAPLLLHYDGSRWTRAPSPPTGGDFGNLFQIDLLQTDSGTDLWIPGVDTDNISRIYRLHNGSWTSWPMPDDNRAWSVSMLTPDEGWAAGDKGILRWNGTDWRTEYSGRGVRALAMIGGQMWAVGAGDAVLSRAVDGTWTLHSGGPATRELFAASALNPEDVWAVGMEGTVVHYSNGSAERVATTFTSTLMAVQMVSTTEGYAVGGNLGPSTYGVIVRWDGSQWTQVATPRSIMRGLAMTGSGEGWAVGDQGEIWRAQGGVWAPVSSHTLTNLSAVAMDSPNHGWAVGGYYSGPHLLEYSGGDWEDRSNLLPPVPPYISYGLTAIALAPGGGEGWVVGLSTSDSKTEWIFHLRAGVWTQDVQLNHTWLAAVAIDALGEAWASGYEEFGGGVVYHYRGGSWHKEDVPSNQVLYGLALVPGRGGLAVGWNGTILRYQPLAQGQRFYDVPPTDTFYTYIEHLASTGIVSGYWDNTFRPYNLTTRAQSAKIAVLAEAWPIYTPPTPTFRDVPATHTFYQYIETAYSHGIISGYGCGSGCLEYRPGNNVTRGQLCKIVVLAEGWPIYVPPTPTFRDVPVTDPFYGYVETAYSRGAVSGYGCGSTCLEFRPGNNATRGQVSKIVYLAIAQP